MEKSEGGCKSISLDYGVTVSTVESLEMSFAPH